MMLMTIAMMTMMLMTIAMMTMIMTIAMMTMILMTIAMMTMSSLCRNSKRGGMATHAGVALELGIIRPAEGKSRS